jgi:transcriptional regulator with XRE-family HTH domain
MNKLFKTELNISVGKSIRKVRELNGWKQDMIAKQLNISIPAFSKIENGITDVNLSRLGQIADIFNLDIIHLISDHSEGEKVSRVGAIDLIQKKLDESDAEIVILQGKVIKLYEEIFKIG